MEKIKFAHMMAYIGAISNYVFTVDQVYEIEQMINIDFANRSPLVDESVVENLLKAMLTGENINVIKAVRTITKIDLKAAKDLVEKYMVDKPAANS